MGRIVSVVVTKSGCELVSHFGCGIMSCRMSLNERPYWKGPSETVVVVVDTHAGIETIDITIGI